MAPSAATALAHPKVPTKPGQASVDSYHVVSSQQAFDLEHEYAAHNYHPLPIVFAKAKGVHVWDPEVRYHPHTPSGARSVCIARIPRSGFWGATNLMSTTSLTPPCACAGKPIH